MVGFKESESVFSLQRQRQNKGAPEAVVQIASVDGDVSPMGASVRRSLESSAATTKVFKALVPGYLAENSGRK